MRKDDKGEESLRVVNEIINKLWKDDAKRDEVKRKMEKSLRNDHSTSVDRASSRLKSNNRLKNFKENDSIMDYLSQPSNKSGVSASHNVSANLFLQS